ncbi:MAG: hypothetical protein A3A98_00135 [Candidatus Staskawiczbacteria bacterium RIFCSPLOWO2_01_FULL_40_39]|uniref:Response regulatory domain-containing protein n=1 Tax=Candidatus Staskawiczbacteria bacterium RIFCSPHIGHO2_01_FULL_39_25 TaxID=1802202 RepID=A0A1G2HMD5_9BACT|nr:MAG: hypothetical protein A2730_00135 [Candidatus Staskawiczbacteria bacterium RIFCSPHIGHO2_01_FULL_39_25]OGZ73151.1 MAG: hypothetical protein A3A98_00135 [Candidatus Staskawiczbacteria bacterium RIFCSPLOWO2_01_FULL_40_39]OGZ76512.1 MAG: hypothetical protein A3I87_01155 [Candidatus Staskawiczbacteria bacterium RIFCSPLOWO2_02_FULL_39_8]
MTTENVTILHNKKILWVEDDTFLMDIIAKKLSQIGAILIYATEGSQALSIAAEKKPDIIILDILLPGLDGLEILSKLKFSPHTKDIPVIMFSNSDEESQVKESEKLGASGFFIKASVTLDDIIEKISEVLSK